MSVNLKELPSLVWVIPCLLLALALADFPYGYYTFLRLVVCGVAGLLGWMSWRGSPLFRNFSILLFAMAVLFNPLIPVHLSRETWAFLNIGSIAILATHFYLFKVKMKG